VKLCQNCNKNVAVVHSTEMSSGKPVKVTDLCEPCAAEAGLPPSSKVLSISSADLFGLLNLTRTGRKEADVECPACGMKLQEFRVKGRLGCPKDYEVFRPHLEALLEKVQGSTHHVGRKPLRAPAEAGAPAPAPEVKAPARRGASVEKTLETLRKKLHGAVKEEKYEEAARLRDQIAELERGRGGGKGGARG
jgi:protein arginine kinase activator